MAINKLKITTPAHPNGVVVRPVGAFPFGPKLVVEVVGTGQCIVMPQTETQKIAQAFPGKFDGLPVLTSAQLQKCGAMDYSQLRQQFQKEQMAQTNKSVQTLNLEQAKRALVVCFLADIPVVLWGPPGVGKSSIGKQLADELGRAYAIFRTSEKEPTDLGGLPYPVDGKLSYLMTDQLPFDCEDECIVNFDEIDRTDQAMLNVLTQVLLDRSVNGHRLSPNARIMATGNGSSDVGTTPLSEAVAARLCHLYIETRSQGAVESYLEWAGKNGVAPELMGFAKFRQEVWAGRSCDYEEIARPEPRSFDNAARLLQACDSVDFNIADIRSALVTGCVGRAGGVEFLAYWDMSRKAPPIEEILRDPANAPVPDAPDVLHALTVNLVSITKSGKDEARTNAAHAIAHYISRWPNEPQTNAMKQLHGVMESPHFQKWKKAHDESIRAISQTIGISAGSGPLSVTDAVKARETENAGGINGHKIDWDAIRAGVAPDLTKFKF